MTHARLTDREEMSLPHILITFLIRYKQVPPGCFFLEPPGSESGTLQEQKMSVVQHENAEAPCERRRAPAETIPWCCAGVLPCFVPGVCSVPPPSALFVLIMSTKATHTQSHTHTVTHTHGRDRQADTETEPACFHSSLLAFSVGHSLF